MASSSPRGGRLGGLGALFFLATLGGIAYYVQRQSVPSEHDRLRQTVPVAAEEAPPQAPAPVPWVDQLDLAEATLVPIRAASAPPRTGPNEAPLPTLAPDPGAARYVQDLRDGARVLYTLDPVLQDAALTIFRNREVPYAAAVVLDLRDNAVLAMAGHSTMDPQVDPMEVVATAWAPSASTFKLVTATALLGTGKVKPSSKVCFHGGVRGLTDDLLRDDPKLDTRCATLSAAIAHSHNVVMGKLALAYLDQDTLLTTARALGYEASWDFEFPVERSPVQVPADPIERAKMAAGFWHSDMSPLHGALLASVFARDGELQPPHAVASVRLADGSEVRPELAAPKRVIDKKVARQVARMMLGTTTEGTARSSFMDDHGTPYIRGVQVAGKTGSISGRRPPALNYNWFIGFAPADDPEIAFAVLLANEPKWQIKAHYAARRLVQIYLQRREEITRQRRAEFVADGVALPEPTGPATVAAASPGKVPPAKEPPALPPVPGPTPKPAPKPASKASAAP